MAWLVGQSIDRYQVIEQLGQGGMAVVFRAFDTRLERTVALKLIRPDILPDANFLARFEREAKSVAQLSHPNIVTVLDYGDFQGTPYLVMEYIPGGTLKDRLGRPMPWSDAARLLAPIARAMEYAHSHHIIHRDLKPANFLIGESGELLVTDFGIAKLLESTQSKELTGTGVGIGTPEYMAPEQGMGNPVDGRADVYSLGIVLYEMVTGRRPYQADTPMAVILKHISDPLPPPSQYNSSIPTDVEGVICKALAKNPEDRYASMRDYANALERLTQSAPTESTKRRERQVLPPQAVQPKKEAPVPEPPAQPAPQTPPPQSKPAAKASLPASKILIPLGIVLIACVGLAVLAAAGYFGSSLLPQFRQSPTAAVSQQNNAAETRLSPTPAATAGQAVLQTQAPLANTEMTTCSIKINLPVEGDWPAALCEFFDENTHQWSGIDNSGKSNPSAFNIQKGEAVFDLTAPGEDFVYLALPGQVDGASKNQFGDLLAAADGQHMGGDPGAFYGIVFHAGLGQQPGHWFFYGLNDQRQTFTFLYFDGKEVKELIKEVQFPLINREGSNQISVISQGNQFSLFINGTKAADYPFYANDFPADHLKGAAGLAARVHPFETTTTIVFDDFVIKVP